MKRAFMNVLLAAAVTVCAARLDAQAALPNVGERVRVDLRNGERVAGRVVSTSQDTLRVRSNLSELLLFTRPQIQSYTVAEGRDRRRGALRGGIVGGVVGVGLIVAGEIADSQSSDDAIIPAAAFTIPAALLTTGLGAGFGALFGPTAWSPQIQVGLDRRQDSQRLRVGLGLSRSVGF